jgi:hypothetical protein
MINFIENKNVFQILITDDPAVSIPAEIEACMLDVKAKSAGYNHFYFDGSVLEALIANNFNADVLKCFRGLVPYAYKADLGRYCLLYLYGGWYLDASVTLNIPLPPISGINHVFFKDGPNPGVPSWDVSNGLIYAAKGSLIMSKAIEMVVANFNNDWYGINALCPTGPNLLGRVIAMNGPSIEILTGNYLSLTPQHYFKNFSYILPDGRILAWGKKTTGTPSGNSLDGLGLSNGNSYAALYHGRRIYRRD